MNRYEAAIAAEKARQILRENHAAGKATQTDADRVRDAEKEYTDASR